MWKVASRELACRAMRLDRIPYTLLAVPLRFAVAIVFWNSGMTKRPNWDLTVVPFTDEYQVSLLRPEVAAYMATTIELTTPVMAGVPDATGGGNSAGHEGRDLFVYLMACPTPIQWAAMLLILLARGPGKLSFDWLIWCRLSGGVRSGACDFA